MQISALEVTKLLSTGPTGKTKTKLDFVKVTPDSLPETVTPSAEEIARIVGIVNETPETRDDIVMELKERVEKGEYNVSGEEIADMMIRRMQADLTR